MVPLGDELRADDEIDFALLDLGELLAQALDGGDEIAREHQDALLRKKARELLLEPLDARPAGDEGICCLAFGARGWWRHREPAVMADEPVPEAMVDEPGIAMWALQAEAAGATERERRIAAPVEEQQCLVAATECR